MAVRVKEQEIFPNAAGIDVGASNHWVAVPAGSSDEPVREFGAMTDDLNAMATWLIACGVDTVALESTGVYWIPAWQLATQSQGGRAVVQGYRATSGVRSVTIAAWKNSSTPLARTNLTSTTPCRLCNG